MNRYFAKTLHRLRTEKKLSQQQLAEKLYVERSTVASWETGRRVPDAVMIARLAECLDTNVAFLLKESEKTAQELTVILVDDEPAILEGGVAVLKKALPQARVAGFQKPSEALRFARSHKVLLAFLDIKLGNASGLALCRELLEIYPHTNVIYLTAYVEFAFDAWETGACAFMLKPITVEGLQAQLPRLRYPIAGLDCV